MTIETKLHAYVTYKLMPSHSAFLHNHFDLYTEKSLDNRDYGFYAIFWRHDSS